MSGSNEVIKELKELHNIHQNVILYILISNTVKIPNLHDKIKDLKTVGDVYKTTNKASFKSKHPSFNPEIFARQLGNTPQKLLTIQLEVMIQFLKDKNIQYNSDINLKKIKPIRLGQEIVSISDQLNIMPFVICPPEILNLM